MTFRSVAGAALLMLAGCGAATVPDSNPNAGGGVGFNDYGSYSEDRARRDAMLEARSSAASTEEMVIAQETLGVLNETRPGGSSAPQGGTVVASAQVPAPSNSSISDEQNFDAVAARETIESDRERLQRQRAAFEIAQPEAVPDRPTGRAAPNIVNYALSTSNGVGQPVHRRSSRYNEDRYRNACAEFASSDQAQAAFLASGGPEKDRRGLDPDGDGFACFWDPSPFRTARGG